MARAPPGARAAAVTALALAWAAGIVDVVGYLTIERVYTANMTGNLVALGIRLARAKWSELALRATPLASFMAGLLVASLFQEWAHRRGKTKALIRPLLLETALLGGVALCGASQAIWERLMAIRLLRDGLVACLAFAMGLQNGTFTRVGALVVRTTHVTGIMLKLSESLSDFGFWLRERVHRGGWAAAARESGSQPGLRHAAFLAGMLGLYLGGAVVSTALVARWGALALAGPAALVAAIAAADAAGLTPPGKYEPRKAREGGE